MNLIGTAGKTKEERKELYRKIVGLNRSMLTKEEDNVLSRWAITNGVSVGVLIMILPVMIRWYIKTRNKSLTPE